MIKRFNKMAALLVAATTVASLGTAVNAAERLNTKEGTIEHAIAFDNGNYIYDGYMTDDDESGLYFHDSKDNFLEEDDYYDFSDSYIKYGTKYAVVENDGDNYVVDLSTGEILDDETIDDKRENLEYKLKSTFNKVDRYEKLSSPVELTQILQEQFGDIWYSYSVDTTDTIKGTAGVEGVTGVKAVITVTPDFSKNTDITIAGKTFTYSAIVSEENKFNNATEFAALISTDTFAGYTANVDGSGVVTLTQETAKTFKAENLADLGLVNASAVVTTEGVTEVAAVPAVDAKAVKAYGFVNESGKYIDASVLANITVVNGTKTTKVTEFNDEKDGVTLKLKGLEAIAQDSKNIYALAKVDVEIQGQDTVEKTYVQRISKSQGSKEDDAYLPSKVESYEVNANYFLDGDNDDYSDAAELINGDNEFRVINDVLYVTKTTSDNVEVSTIKLKKAKVTTSKDSSTKYDLYLAELDKQDDQDMQDSAAYSIDADGNTWVLKKGKIYKFTGKEFEEVYSCDRSMDRIDVYNSSNLIVWEEGEDVFATLGGKETSEEEDTTTDSEDTTVQTGWVKNSDGTWSFINADGTKKTGWLNDNGTWYMLNSDGIMATGWYNDRGTWYYMQSSGAMKTGWLNDRGTWYYMQSSGAMKTGWLNDNGTWYYMQSSGAMKTGWLKDTDGRWYYLQSSGAMATNTTIGGYVLGANGAWIR